MDDASVDTHLCIRCNETIVGIGAYLDHRREDCLVNSGSTGFASSNSVTSLLGATNSGSVSQTLGGPAGDARDILDIPFLPDVPELPDFFLSLDLQRIAPIAESVDDIGDEVEEKDDDEDLDPFKPPRGHTGGKWRPGCRPSIMQGFSCHKDTLQGASPERLPDMLEKMGCAPCGRIFRDKYTYQRHLESELHRKRSLRNAKIIHTQCPPVEADPPELLTDSPMRRSRPSRMKCKADSPFNVSMQTKKKIKKAQCRCTLCFRWFQDTRGLNIHMGEHRGPDGLHCSQCSQKFSGEKELRLHLKTHKEHQKCCGTVFTTVKGYREHNQRVHPAIREWLSCPNCKRMYRTNRALREHICDGSDEKIPCTDCDYVGNQKNLALHRRTHANDKRYNCLKCNYRAVRHGQLWRHMKLHEGEKTYRCPYCDYSCVLVENLRAHILKGSKHKGLKVYPCEKCSFGTNNSMEAKRHADSHQLSQ
ncbi:zinc finger protein-like [Tropilaelaps mercedesae]|uniref:Zinc finger protein-like n=1 Tax=Tropilaelaps mercedesae TaxID=418985 RepID=A0A1V9X6D7_9ACAR|nr:zinc finger protein-like [Tropilaelaps mercedesae]